MGTPSFRNQAELIIKTAKLLGYEAELRFLKERADPKKDRFDRCITLGPLWPRYVFDSVRFNTPWLSRKFTFYGPVDGPFNMNITFFKVAQQMEIVTTSKWCMEQIQKSPVPCEAFIHHGLDFTDFEFTEGEINYKMAMLRRMYPDKTIFFTNLNPLHRKGFGHLFKAVQILAKTRKPDFVVIIHTGLKKALAFEKRLNKVSNIVVEDAYGSLPFRQIALKTRCCDCFIFPSLLEGFGLPVLEAMRSARPIICVNMGPLTEMVDFDTAYLVDFNKIIEEDWKNPGCKAQLHDYDPKELAYTMEYVMDHPEEAQEKGQKALVKSENFNYLDKYTALIEGSY